MASGEGGTQAHRHTFRASGRVRARVAGRGRQSGANTMKVIDQLGAVQAGVGALSLRRARHCCASLSLSCRLPLGRRLAAARGACQLVGSPRGASARRRASAAGVRRGPKSSISSCLASARRSGVSSVTLTHDSSHRFPSEWRILLFPLHNRARQAAGGCDPSTHGWSTCFAYRTAPPGLFLEVQNWKCWLKMHCV